MRRFVYNPCGRVNFSTYLQRRIIRRKQRRIFPIPEHERRQTVINGKQTASRKSPELLAVFVVTRGSILYLRSRPADKILATSIGSEIQSWLFYQSAWIALRRIKRSRCFPTLFFCRFCFCRQKTVCRYRVACSVFYFKEWKMERSRH